MGQRYKPLKTKIIWTNNNWSWNARDSWIRIRLLIQNISSLLRKVKPR